MDFARLIPVIVSNRVALLVGFFLLDVGCNADRLAKINIPVKSCYLELANLILGLTHHVRNTLSRLEV